MEHKLEGPNQRLVDRLNVLKKRYCWGEKQHGKTVHRSEGSPLGIAFPRRWCCYLFIYFKKINPACQATF